MQIPGSTALVTGGGRRVGKAIVLALAAAGADVAIHYNSSASEAEKTADEARALGVAAGTFEADLSDPESASRLIEDVGGSFGVISILINNASMFSKQTFEETSLDVWDAYMSVNFRTPFLLAQAMQRALPEGQTGKVIGLNDWRTARANRFAYGVSKAALSGLNRSLAVAMAPNVQVNEVALGAILPPADSDGSETGEHVAKASPAGRMGRLDEVTGAIISLIENDFITGETLHIDGGRHIR